MKKSHVFPALLLIISSTILTSPLAAAHQPVNLTSANKSADLGPILVDGSISFAIRANFSAANQTQGFRAVLQAGDLLNFEYLIIDRTPENKLAKSKLPIATITDPAGKKIIIKFTERSKFNEPYTNTNYLYLARYSQSGVAGVYKITLQSKAKAAITVAVGSKETLGQVLQAGECPTWQSPPGEFVIAQGYAQALVGMKKEVAVNCANKLNWKLHIGQEDDQLFAMTKDYRMDRVTVTIKKGVITQSLVG